MTIFSDDLAAILADCGSPVTIGSVPLTALVEWESVLDDRGVLVRTGRRQAIVATVDLPTITRRSTTLVSDGHTYRIEDYEPDDYGSTILYLGEVES